MKRFFLFFILLGCFFQLEAQERTANDTILMLENKIWRAEFPSEKSIRKRWSSERVDGGLPLRIIRKK